MTTTMDTATPLPSDAPLSTFEHFVDGRGLTPETWTRIDATLDAAAGAFRTTTGDRLGEGGLGDETALDAEKALALARMGMLARDGSGTTAPIETLTPRDAAGFAASRLTALGDGAKAAIEATAARARAAPEDELTRAMTWTARREALTARLATADAETGRVLRRASISTGVALVSRVEGSWLGAADALELALLVAESAGAPEERAAALKSLAETLETLGRGDEPELFLHLPTFATVTSDTVSALDAWLASADAAPTGNPAPEGFSLFGGEPVRESPSTAAEAPPKASEAPTTTAEAPPTTAEDA